MAGVLMELVQLQLLLSGATGLLATSALTMCNGKKKNAQSVGPDPTKGKANSMWPSAFVIL